MLAEQGDYEASCFTSSPSPPSSGDKAYRKKVNARVNANNLQRKSKRSNQAHTWAMKDLTSFKTMPFSRSSSASHIPRIRFVFSSDDKLRKKSIHGCTGCTVVLGMDQ